MLTQDRFSLELFVKQRVQVGQGFWDQAVGKVAVNRPVSALGTNPEELLDDGTGAAVRQRFADAVRLFSDPVMGQCSHMTDSGCLYASAQNRIFSVNEPSLLRMFADYPLYADMKNSLGPAYLDLGAGGRPFK